MDKLKKRFTYLFTSTKGLALTEATNPWVATAAWGMLSGPMVEWGVKDFVVKLLGMD